MECRGFSAPDGSWKIICTRRRSARSRDPCAPARPRRRSLPWASGSSPMIERMSVVLPQPDSPTSATTSPRPHRARPCRRRAPRPPPELHLHVGRCDHRLIDVGCHDSPPPTCTHAARRPLRPAARSARRVVLHSGTATEQRGWNGQPVGSAEGSGGSPAKPCGFMPRGGVADRGERRRERPRVRVLRLARTRPCCRAVLHDAAGVHHRQALAGVGEHRQVVGDEQQRQAVLALQLLQQRPAPAPAPSRRARWWARRRSAGFGSQASASAMSTRWR
jgi:hypothetical protein